MQSANNKLLVLSVIIALVITIVPSLTVFSFANNQTKNVNPNSGGNCVQIIVGTHWGLPLSWIGYVAPDPCSIGKIYYNYVAAVIDLIFWSCLIFFILKYLKAKLYKKVIYVVIIGIILFFIIGILAPFVLRMPY